MASVESHGDMVSKHRVGTAAVFCRRAGEDPFPTTVETNRTKLSHCASRHISQHVHKIQELPLNITELRHNDLNQPICSSWPVSLKRCEDIEHPLRNGRLALSLLKIERHHSSSSRAIAGRSFHSRRERTRQGLAVVEYNVTKQNSLRRRVAEPACQGYGAAEELTDIGALEDIVDKREALKRQILVLGLVHPGSLVRRFYPAGTPPAAA